MEGIVVYYNKSKSHGFIKSFHDLDKIHFNIEDWNNAKEPARGDKVEFQTRITQNNNFAAQYIVLKR